jgi:photosystem II stability/assembly factor-like uncharacterized protein
METLLLLATGQGLVVCERRADGWRELRRGLASQYVTSAIGREGVILAGTRAGVFHSDDLGETWVEASDGLSISHVRWLAYHPDISDLEFAGTEPAGIFVSHDGAQSWRACPEVVALREEHGWSLPYSPEAGCVRGFAFHGSRGYAAVEDGCVLVSDDAGETWELAAGSRGRADHHPSGVFIHSDVHSIAVHPSSPDRVAAPTGGGFYTSGDGGMTWKNIYARSYCRAAWLDPLDPNHILLGPADGVDVNGRIEETRDGGRTWQPASAGLQVPWRRHMVERFSQAGDQLLAVLSNGDLLAAFLDSLHWEQILPEVKGVNAAAVMKDGE